MPRIRKRTTNLKIYIISYFIYDIIDHKMKNVVVEVIVQKKIIRKTCEKFSVPKGTFKKKKYL